MQISDSSHAPGVRLICPVLSLPQLIVYATALTWREHMEPRKKGSPGFVHEFRGREPRLVRCCEGEEGANRRSWWSEKRSEMSLPSVSDIEISNRVCGLGLRLIS